MRGQVRVILALLALLGWLDPLQAKGDPDAIATPPVELVVFESSDCAYCLIFRKNIARYYPSMPQGRTAPMRFVQIEDTASAGLVLREPISIAPTAVLIRNGREIDRIVGYTGPDLFFDLINHLLARGD